MFALSVTILEIYAVEISMTLTFAPLERAKVKSKYANQNPIILCDQI